MPESLTATIDAALATVINPRTGKNLIESEMVRDVATTREGAVRFTLLLSPADDARLVRDARQAVEAAGVANVRVDVKDPNEKPAPKSAASRTLPVMDAAPAAAPRPHAPTPVAYPHLGRIIAVSSGKGGVGKTTVCVNLAVALAKAGARVGILDADVYGPNIPRMLGVNAPPPVENEKIMPLEAHGVKIMSIGFLIERDQPAIWRGPIVMKIVTQFLRDVNWGVLDYLFVDMPPGTGDAQLSLVQATHVTGAVIVTTPQEVAVGDALRGAKMFERVNVPVLGIVENMSYFESPATGKPLAIFGSGGGKRLADELHVPLLGEIPLYTPVREGGDDGRPIVEADERSNAARQLTAVAARIAERTK
ncbi:MAG TPA: Mrp/NBP35 family ATP-binding protein [Gemmatimonadaceae bacterium]|nr:Mrp/NBP35 family ATP-binding protein [Gemmatimonadaceae bacterium]